MKRGGADLLDRTFRFSVRAIQLSRRLESDRIGRVLVGQLLRSATSIGANAEEAQAGQSRADFLSKNAICLKEARETRYWLRLLQAAEVSVDPELAELEQEAFELMRIFGSIVATTRRTPGP